MSQPLAIRSLGSDVLIDGKYRIEGEVGRGGMGVVYVAHHVALDRKFAVKVLTLDAEQAAPRFLREARAAARLQSEHVVRVSDVGTAEGVGPYMVMELLVGADLGQELATHGPLPIAEAVDAILQTCDALAEAHAIGIVHRDLKPANLFVAERSDGTRIVKVLDFGISKVTSFSEEAQKLTETRSLVGSPYYMSPEQLRSSRDVDARADIWSLGIVFYELVTGQMPFEGDSVGAIFANILEKSAPSARLLRPELPPELDDVIFHCLQRLPENRFQSAGELARALAPFGSGKAGAAVQRAGSFIGKSPWNATSPPLGSHVRTTPSLGGSSPSSSGATGPTASAVSVTGRRESARKRLGFGWAALLLVAVGGVVTVLFFLRYHGASRNVTASPSVEHASLATASVPSVLVPPPPVDLQVAPSAPPVASVRPAPASFAPPNRPRSVVHSRPSTTGNTPSDPDFDRRR